MKRSIYRIFSDEFMTDATLLVDGGYTSFRYIDETVYLKNKQYRCEKLSLEALTSITPF